MIGDTAIRNTREGEAEKRDQAFERLWQEHRTRIWRLVARLAGSADDADDLTQEVSLRAYSAYAGFHERSSFATWLHRIAVNVVLRHREKHSNTSLSIESDALDSQAGDPGLEPESAILASAVRPIVWAAINRLPADLRTTLILQVYEGLKYREIAVILDISLETVKYRRHQAMLRLREELHDYEL